MAVNGAALAAADEFSVERGDPFIRVANFASKGHVALCCLMFFVIAWVPKLVIAAASSDLYVDQNVLRDLADLFFFAKETGSKRAEIPLTRDYVDFLIALLMSAHFGIVVRQWRRLSATPQFLLRRNAIAPDVPDSELVDAIRFHGWIGRSLIPSILAVAASLFVCWTIYWSVSSDGIYSGLDSAGHSAEQHYETWWANPDDHTAAFAAQIWAYFLYFYVIMRHTVVGLIAINLLMTIQRKSSDPAGKWFCYGDPVSFWPENQQCFRHFQLIVLDVAWSVILLMSALVLSAFYIDTTHSIILVLFLGYFVYNPVVFVVPVVVFNGQLRRSATEWAEAASVRRRTAWEAVDNKYSAAAEAHRLRADAWFTSALALPRDVVGAAALFRYLLIYIIPVIVGAMVAVSLS